MVRLSLRVVHTFPMNLFIFWTPMRALTVFCIRPAETTTAFICREAEAASRIVGMVVFGIVGLGRRGGGCGG